MRLRTKRLFHTTPEDFWPLLFGSEMDSKKPCYFLCGLPKPLECRLRDKEGGVGKIRECVSDKGVIKQTILVWEPNKKLVFELSETDIYFGPCIKSIVESFELEPVGDKQTMIVRETKFEVVSSLKYCIAFPMFIGLKSIHRYVFKNWHRISVSRKKARDYPAV